MAKKPFNSIDIWNNGVEIVGTETGISSIYGIDKFVLVDGTVSYVWQDCTGIWKAEILLKDIPLGSSKRHVDCQISAASERDMAEYRTNKRIIRAEEVA